MLQEAGHIKNYSCFNFSANLTLHLMSAKVAWVLLSSETQVQPRVILDPGYLPDYLSVPYNYVIITFLKCSYS